MKVRKILYVIANHSPTQCGLAKRVAPMLRIGLFASAIPLILVGILARGETSQAGRCIALGEGNLQIALVPWQTQLDVGFTDDPATATVRVQIVDNAETADFVLVDDPGSAPAEACGVDRWSGILAVSGITPTSGAMIYLSREDNADYRIFVRSSSYSARDAAALIVGAGRVQALISTAALVGGS